MSPTEHPAPPMNFIQDNYELNWEKGITHMDRNGYFWSGNLRGWIQYRQLLNYESQRLLSQGRRFDYQKGKPVENRNFLIRLGIFLLKVGQHPEFKQVKK